MGREAEAEHDTARRAERRTLVDTRTLEVRAM
jgi:hypothetical protein